MTIKQDAFVYWQLMPLNRMRPAGHLHVRPRPRSFRWITE